VSLEEDAGVKMSGVGTWRWTGWDRDEDWAGAIRTRLSD
jgi:hypothetical protein